MADMFNMTGGLNPEREPDLTGDVEVNKLTSLQRQTLERTAEIPAFLSSQFKKCNRIRELDFFRCQLKEC